VIDFTRAFETAWERMLVILFRPFDLGKWCVIGFSAFLAGLIAGGNGVSGSFNFNSFNPNRFAPATGQATPNVTTPQVDLHQLNTQLGHLFTGMTMGIVIVLAVLAVLVILAITLTLFWLGARGQFMFLDNIVRNRGAVEWPWTNYSREANSVFWLYVQFILLSFVLLLPIFVAAIFLCIPLFQQNRMPHGSELTALIVLGVLYVLISLAINLVLFFFREFGVPIMFRQRVSARSALTASLNLVLLHPGSVCLFLLLRLAIFIGLAVICVIVCIATCCCLYQIPYLGTLFILPVLVFTRCFTLDCLAQFGPQYDVFSVDVPPGSAPAIDPPLNPQRPPG
jgi:hypothetical protein